MRYKKRAVAALLIGAFTFGSATTAVAGGEPAPTGKCNSGRGNQSETTPETDCDPGNSGGHNSGGD